MNDGRPAGAVGQDTRGAPVGAHAFLDQALWKQFREAVDPEAYIRAWLDLQCGFIEGVVRAVVVLGEPETGPFAPAALWPDDRPPSPELSRVAEQAMSERQGVVMSAGHASGDGACLGHPLIMDDLLYGVVAVQLGSTGGAVRPIMRQLQWGSAWVEVLLRRQQGAENDEQRERAATAFDLIAAALEQERMADACNALVTDLATRLDCDPVSLGTRSRGRTKVLAVSHAAQFGERMNLVRDIGLAMDEAIDQEAVVAYPPRENWEYRVTRAHADLAKAHQADVILTVPLHARGKVFGAFTFERAGAGEFDEATVELCDVVSAVLGPILYDKQREDRSIWRKNIESGRVQLQRLLGPRYFGRKLATAIFVLLTVFFTFVPGDYRVTAPVVVEGQIQRLIVAPFEGYLATQSARAGEVVKAGQVLATLDDRDLALERLRWSTTRRQRLAEYDRALADRNRAEANIVLAQVDQAEAQIALLDEQLKRTRIKAPFDSVVVSGDLSQSIGVALQPGEELFTVAPLTGYRVILEVDETEIRDVRKGQRGELRLVSAPEQAFAFTVVRITPIAEQADGRNYFRVEASLDESGDRLRPGMEGVGKIEVEGRLLIRIWTEKMVDWFRLMFWKWMP